MTTKTKSTEIVLCNPRHISTEYDQRSSIDRRIRVDYHVYGLQGSNGECYRRAFETKPGQSPVIPAQMKLSLPLLQKQW